MIVNPCAKINLGLNVVNKRDDGYHNLETVFYPVNLVDTLSIEERPTANDNMPACSLSVEGINIDGDNQDNLVVKAYKLLKERFPKLPEVSVKLTKDIPTQAGMGGGSSDCAYMIKTLNEMFELNMSLSEMQALSAKLGADCAFFINPVPSFATGIGEELSPIDVNLGKYTLAIVKPPLKISTKDAFSSITPQKPMKCCREIVRQPVETWKTELVNDFERSIFSLYPEVADIKKKLYDLGAVYASMSGSGSAFFGIFEEKPDRMDKHFDNYFTRIL